MKRLIKGTSICKPTFIFCILILVVLSAPPSIAERIEVTLSGKGISGPYFPTAGTIATLVNQKRNDHGIRITVKSRRDSVSILKSVMSGEFECGVVRMNRISQAVKGLAEWKGNQQTALRSILNVQAEQIGLVVSAQSGIRMLADLKGKRVFIGGPRSDLRHDAMQILDAVGIDPRSDLTTSGAAVEEAPELMQDNAIDAFFYIVGITNRAFIDLVSGPQTLHLVPISGPDIDKMIATSPFVEKAIISIAPYSYFANTSNVETVGFKAGLITATRVPDKIVYTIAEAVVENFEYFKNRYPASATMTRNEMTRGMIAPVHQGAEQFYKELGFGYSLVLP